MTATMTPRTTESVIEAVEMLRPVIALHRDEGERDRQLSSAIIEAIRTAGIARLWVPREYGGYEVDLPTFMAAVERIATMDSAAGWTFANSCGGAVITAFLPPEAAREVYAGGPDIFGAGTINPRGRAVPADGGYRLSGQWPLISGAHNAAYMGVGALVFEGDAPRMGPQGPDLRLMTIPPEECTVLDTWHSLGLRGTDSTDITVDDVYVPEYRVFSPFASPPQVAGALYRGGIMPLFAFALTTVSLGIARASIDAFVDLAMTKTPTMSQTPLADRPTVHAELAKAEAGLQSARAYLFEAAREFMAALESGAPIPDRVEARRRLATTNCAAACEEVVDAMFRLAGATPVYSGHPLERCLRDMHTLRQHTFVSPAWWEKTGQFYLGRGLGMP